LYADKARLGAFGSFFFFPLPFVSLLGVVSSSSLLPASGGVYSSISLVYRAWGEACA